MAHRPARICICGRRVPASARCSCEKQRDRERPSARKRGYDTEFQKAAAAYLKAHPRCTCGKPAVLVRHKISIAQRPDLRMDRSNWMPGCRSCNVKDWHRDRREAGGGRNVEALGSGTARGNSARFSRNWLSGPEGV